MKFWRNPWKKTFPPIDRVECRRQLVRYLLSQILIAGTGVLVFLWGNRSGNPYLQLGALITLAIAGAIQNYRVMKSDIFARRLADLHPELEHKFPVIDQLAFGTIYCSPVLFPIFLLFALTSVRKHGDHLLRFQRRVRLLGITNLILLFAPLGLAVISVTKRPIPVSQIGYMITNPTSAYILGVTDEVTQMTRLKSSLKRLSDTSQSISAIEHTVQSYPVSTTGTIMAESLIVSEYMKKRRNRDRAIATTESDDVALIEAIVALNESREQKNPQ